jgi:hypothetical protein
MSAQRTPSAALAVMSLIVGIVVGLLGAVPAAADPDPLPPAPSPEPAQKGAAAPPPAPPPAPRPPPVQVAPVQVVPIQPLAPAHPPPLTPGPDADVRFLSLMSDIPGVVLTDPDAAVASARGMCTAMQYGLTPDQEVMMTQNNTGLTREHAEEVIAGTIAVYCPYLAHKR